MAEAIRQLEPTLWAFVHMEQVEPINNRAERALHPAVCMRKGNFGTHSAEGSRYLKRILTAVTTLKQQQRNVLDYLTEAMRAHLAWTGCSLSSACLLNGDHRPDPPRQ